MDAYTASEDVFITSDKNDLDYTLIRLNNNPSNSGEFIELNKNSQFKVGSFCNIIQHPDGRYKEISIHENRLTKYIQNIFNILQTLKVDLLILQSLITSGI